MESKEFPISLVEIEHSNVKWDQPCVLRWWNEWGGAAGFAVLIIAWLNFVDFMPEVFACLVLLWGCMRIWNRKYSKADAKRAKMDKFHLQNNKRLTCYGHPIELERLRFLSQEFFPPHVFKGRRSLKGLQMYGSVTQALRRTKLDEILAIIAVVLIWYAGHPLAAILVGAAVFMVGWLVAARRSVFYRVVPQRLEILSFSRLSLRRSLMKSISLSDASILCHFGREQLSIHRTDSSCGAIDIDLTTLESRHGFVQAIFTSALSPWIAPDLPSDELLG